MLAKQKQLRRKGRVTLVVCTAVSVGAGCLVFAGPAQARRDARSWLDQGITSGIKGVDVSLWQHGNATELSFPALRSAGVQFAIIKASDGSARGDKSAARFWAQDAVAAHAAGMVVGSYHFGQPTADSTKIVADARAEASQAARRTGAFRRGYLATALDLESAPYKLSKKNLTLWAVTWLDTYKRMTGRTPYLYSYTYFLETRLRPVPELTKYPLWIADYGRGQATPEKVTGWPIDAVKLWQFTSSGKLRGSGSSTIDLDVFLGSKKQFRKRALVSRKAAARYGL